MKEFDQFRDADLAQRVVENIRRIAPSSPVKFCHVCGTHEWTITHFGLRDLLPDSVEVVAGPGCPVCILPAADIDEAIMLALKGVTVTTFGDVLRVPGSDSSLSQARADGGDVRVVYGVNDAVRIARKERGKDFVFFAIGFETTAPSTANEILRGPPENLTFLLSHRLIPPAMEWLLGLKESRLDGFVAPGHVSTIIGLKPYSMLPEKHHVPVVVAGFEPLDVLFAINMLLRQLKTGVAELENEYERVVRWNGNVKAIETMNNVFKKIDGDWRGLGCLSSSAFSLRDEFEMWDARKRHDLSINVGRDVLPGCQCHLIMAGRLRPTECKLFMTTCTPDYPKGPCMVSMEGTCSIWAKHGIKQ